MKTRQFRVVVDGRGMVMILPEPATVQQAYAAAVARFGISRVNEVEPV